MAINSAASYNPKEAYDQACQELLDAIDTEQILDSLGRGMYVKNRQTEPPKSALPSVENLCDFLRGDDTAQRKVESEGEKLLHFFLIESQTSSYPEKNKKPMRTDSNSIELQVHFRFEPGHAYVVMFLGCMKHPDAYGDAFELAHRAWFEARKCGYKGNHPLAPIVTAWQNRPPEIHSTSIYDARRPAGIMRYPRGNFDIELFSDGDMGKLRRFADGAALPDLQMVLPGFEKKSIIRNPNKVMLAHVDGVPKTTRKGAVSPELRIFVEAIMAVPANERIARVRIKLDELISRLYPGPTPYNWTNQSVRLLNAIRNIDNMTVPFVNSSGRIQKGWAPVKLNTMDFYRRDDDVIFSVTLPDSVSGGPMVEKHFVRLLGLKSDPKWQAYLTLCDLFHRYGIHKNKDGNFNIYDPTKPVERRNDEGHLINAKGEVIYGTDGEPLKNPYDPAAVEQLDREPNPQAIEKYPIVSDDDMLKACFPGREYKNASEQTKYLKRAKKHFRELADQPSKAFGNEPLNVIRIIEHADGWQFLPGESHIDVYRGVSYRPE